MYFSGILLNDLNVWAKKKKEKERNVTPGTRTTSSSFQTQENGKRKKEDFLYVVLSVCVVNQKPQVAPHASTTLSSFSFVVRVKLLIL